MFKQIAFSSAVAIVLLVAPTTKLFSQSTTPGAVTGGDPQPTGEATVSMLTIIPSLVVL